MSGFEIVAVDTRTLPGTIPSGDIVFTLAQPIPIASGDRIGLYGPDANAGCDFSGTQSSGDVMRRAEFASSPTAGAPVVPLAQESTFHRVDVAAEMTVGGGSGGGDSGGGSSSPGTGSTPTSDPPTIGPDGKPSTTKKGRTSRSTSPSASSARR